MIETGLFVKILAWVAPVLIAITFHEAAHGWTAWKLGDDTAYKLGRVTFNPFRHVDPFGTVLLPGLLLLISGGSAAFGYAKPVPVNFWRLRNRKRDTIMLSSRWPLLKLDSRHFFGRAVDHSSHVSRRRTIVDRGHVVCLNFHKLNSICFQYVTCASA